MFEFWDEEIEKSSPMQQKNMIRFTIKFNKDN